jgi:HemY protein
MTRLLFGVLIIVFVAGVALALAGDPGSASLSWLGWRIDTSAAAGATLLVLATLLATLFWKAVVWFIEAPARSAKARAEARRREGGEALSRGFVAVAAGAGADARRLAAKAGDYLDEHPSLVRLLAAQAAEAAGDSQAAQAAYAAMLGFPDLKLAGHRGLMLLAQKSGDAAEAVRQAEAAYGLAKTSRWAWRALLQARLASGEWDAASALAKEALDRKIIAPAVAERARAALLAASAAWREEAGDAKALESAAELSLQAAKLRPDFTPGVIIAARRLALEGKTARAAQLIEAAWKERPHPALALSYRDLIQTETPKARARRLGVLVDLKPGHVEGRMVAVEQALLDGDPERARSLAETLDRPEATTRVCALMARVALSARRTDEARAWVARAALAPKDADWSDIDAEGRAFAYGAADWSRLVSAYAETGELIHPRLERGERSLSELPDLPVAYNASAAFLAEDETGRFAPPLPDDPGFELEEPELSAPPPPLAPPPRRRRSTR